MEIKIIAKRIFNAIVDFLKRNIWTIVPVLGAAGGVIIVLGLPFLNFRGDTLQEASKTAECGEDLQAALRSFSQKMDMQYAIEPEDYNIVFNKGEIKKEYYRDGIRYMAYFHLNKTEAGCYLKFYKRGKLEPGHFSTTLGNYGSVFLKNCRCNGEKIEKAEPGGERKHAPEKEEPKEGKNYVWIDLGKNDRGLLLTLAPDVTDGITRPDVKAGVECKKLPFPYAGPGDNHMYFNIEDSFLKGGDNEVWIVMEYFDGGAAIDCQYDGNGAGPMDGAFRGAYDGAFPMLELTNTDTWKVHIWHIRDGRFKNRCNGYDFRFSTHGRGNMWVNRVWLFLYEPLESSLPRLGQSRG